MISEMWNPDIQRQIETEKALISSSKQSTQASILGMHAIDTGCVDRMTSIFSYIPRHFGEECSAFGGETDLW